MRWILFEQIQYMSYSQRDALDKLWKNNPNFASSQGHGNNRDVQSIKDHVVYYKEVTMDERRETLYNRIMIPDTSVSNIWMNFGLLILSITLLY